MNPISRKKILIAMAVTATGAGLLVAQKYTGRNEVESSALNALWDLKLNLPDGTTLAMQNLHGKPLILNFWATWCPPCVEELPLLERFYRENASKGWQIVAIAADSARAVSEFLVKLPLSFPTPLAGIGGVEMSKSLGNLSGGLPFTVVIDTEGSIVLRHMGKLNASQVQQFVALK